MATEMSHADIAQAVVNRMKEVQRQYLLAADANHIEHALQWKIRAVELWQLAEDFGSGVYDAITTLWIAHMQRTNGGQRDE